MSAHIHGIKSKEALKAANTRVSFDGKYWYLSYAYEIEEQISNGSRELGVDLGMKDFAVISDGRVPGIHLRHSWNSADPSM